MYQFVNFIKNLLLPKSLSIISRVEKKISNFTFARLLSGDLLHDCFFVRFNQAFHVFLGPTGPGPKGPPGDFFLFTVALLCMCLSAFVDFSWLIVLFRNIASIEIFRRLIYPMTFLVFKQDFVRFFFACEFQEFDSFSKSLQKKLKASISFQ